MLSYLFYFGNTMKPFFISVSFLALFTLNSAALAAPTENVIEQYGFPLALVNQVYTGDITPAEMLEKGQFGLGTADNLDGELVALNGVVYKIEIDGSLIKAPSNLAAPYMTMFKFNPKKRITLKNVSSLALLGEKLKATMSSKNSFYAYKITGTFNSLKMASAQRVKNDSVPLMEYLKTRVMYTKQNIKGTLVGLYTPDYLGNISIPGMHFHFVSNDYKLGGHLEGISFDEVTVEIEEINKINLTLPQVGKFRAIELKQASVPAANKHK